MCIPESLVKRIRAAYPNNKKIQQAAESGDEILGRYLDDCCPQGISPETILQADTLAELQIQAMQLQEKKAIYHEWLKLRRD